MVKRGGKYRRKVFKVGGSMVVPIPKELRQDLGLGVGDYVELVRYDERSINIIKAKEIWDGRITRKD